MPTGMLLSPNEHTKPDMNFILFVIVIILNNAILLLYLNDIEERKLQPDLLQHTFFNLTVCGILLESGHIHVLERGLHTNLAGVDFSILK